MSECFFFFSGVLRTLHFWRIFRTCCCLSYWILQSRQRMTMKRCAVKWQSVVQFDEPGLLSWKTDLALILLKCWGYHFVWSQLDLQPFLLAHVYMFRDMWEMKSLTVVLTFESIEEIGPRARVITWSQSKRTLSFQRTNHNLKPH